MEELGRKLSEMMLANNSNTLFLAISPNVLMIHDMSQPSSIYTRNVMDTGLIDNTIRESFEGALCRPSILSL